MSGLRLWLVALFVMFASTPVLSHNVWCHCDKVKASDTVRFFHQSGEIYKVLSEEVLRDWHEANSHLEVGVLAEFDHAIDPEFHRIDPESFKKALTGYERMLKSVEHLDRELANLIAIDASTKSVTTYERTLTKILSEEGPFERLSPTGVRYAAAGGTSRKHAPRIEGTAGILTAQQQDLRILASALRDVIAGLRDALPLAERGEFAPVMLSGRNAFGDKMPQFTDMVSAFERFYVRTCMATVATTMQVYPKGFEWLATGAARR